MLNNCARYENKQNNRKCFCFQIKKVYPELNIKLPGKRRLGNNFDPGKTVCYILFLPHQSRPFVFFVNT